MEGEAPGGEARDSRRGEGRIAGRACVALAATSKPARWNAYFLPPRLLSGSVDGVLERLRLQTREFARRGVGDRCELRELTTSMLTMKWAV